MTLCDRLSSRVNRPRLHPRHAKSEKLNGILGLPVPSESEFALEIPQEGNDFRMKTHRISHYRCESFCAPPRCYATKTGIARPARSARASTVIRALAYY
jgi:hypothetical protein